MFCRYRQLLCYDMPDGSLLLTSNLSKRAASGFQEGVNVQRANVAISMDQRYSNYQGVRQSVEMFQDMGTEGFLVASATDAGVQRHRQLTMVLTTGPGQGLDWANARMGWEASRRFGRSASVTLTTDSWRDAAGALYAPNTLVSLDLPSLKVTGRLWTISEVTYRKDDQGTSCDLTIMAPQAFMPEPTLLQPLSAEFNNVPPLPSH